jgi:NADP-dependent 3-hydroxy acid dehydrogenase YdfG
VRAGEGRTALVTGASSGIGAATVRELARQGFDTIAAARRVERCEALAAEVGGIAVALDVTDEASVEALAAAHPAVDVIVHCAGGAIGMNPALQTTPEAWLRMYDVHVVGVLRVTKRLLPALRTSGDAHVVVVSSAGALDVYPGGGGYTASKHGTHALVRTLRLELLGEPIRITEIAPGLVETEFGLVAFDGDESRAAELTSGYVPLQPDDVGRAIGYAVTQPAHVNVELLAINPRAQATVNALAREASAASETRPAA